MSRKKKLQKRLKREQNSQIEKKDKYCTLCEKPHNGKTQLCGGCNNKAIQLTERLALKYKVSINKLLYLKKHFGVDDIFELLDKSPQVLYIRSDRGDRMALKRSVRATHRSDEYQKEQYTKWECEIPSYIRNEFRKYHTKKFIALSGKKKNPNVHYTCLLCEEEQVQRYEDLKHGRGHSCIATKSSGEVLVEKYLRERYIIRTQHETLKCVNPITGYPLPYDIEIPALKAIIEIQGEQHNRYIEYFHGTIENFHYQQRKDAYKKAYAEKMGYRVIYIYYDEIKNGRYIDKLQFQ